MPPEMPLKIFHIVHAYPPIVGGTATRQYNMVRDGNRHILLTRQPEGQNESCLEEPHATIYYKAFINALYRETDIKRWTVKLVKAVWSVRRLLKADKVEFDLVHAHNPTKLAMLSYVVAVMTGRPFVYEMHTLPPYFSQAEQSLYKSARLLKKLDVFLLNRAQGIVVQYEAQWQKIKPCLRCADKPMTIVPVGVSDLFIEKVNPNKKTGRPVSKKTILFNGLLENVNDLPFLLDVIEALKERTDIRFLIAGTGRFQADIEKLAQMHPALIDYRGAVDYEEMPDLYNQADIHFVPCPDLPRWHENLPTKFAESQVAGKVIITADFQNFRQEMGGVATYYRAGDVKAACEAIGAVIDNCDALADMAQTHAITARARYSYQPKWKEMNEFYRRIVQKA